MHLTVSLSKEGVSLQSEDLQNSLQAQHPDRSAGSLPAHWPTFSISAGDTSPDSGSQDAAAQQARTQDPPSQVSPVSSASPGAPIMTYAELLARETSAMRNARGPWKPRIEKTDELLVSLPAPVLVP